MLSCSRFGFAVQDVKYSVVNEAQFAISTPMSVNISFLLVVSLLSCFRPFVDRFRDIHSNIHPKTGNHISPGFTSLNIALSPFIIILVSHINNVDIAIPAHIIPVIKGTIAFSPFVLLHSRGLRFLNFP